MRSMPRREVLFALMLGLALGSQVVAGASAGLTAGVRASAASAPLAATRPPATRGATAPKTLAVVDATEAAAGQHRLDHELRLALDPEQPLAARQTALTAVKQAAQGGNGEAQFVIGSLYMWGPEHPAALLPKDLAKAKTYLSNAAVHGWLEAMAAMAEIELQTDHPENASVWALADYYFSGASHYAAKGYLADLIHRCEQLLTKAQRDKALADANVFIARYQADIRTAHAENKLHPPACSLRYVSPRKRRAPETIGWSSDVPRSGNAMFFVGVNREGRVERVLPINSFPSWRVFRITRRMAYDTRFNPAPACGKTLRWGTMPFDYGSGEYEFNR